MNGNFEMNPVTDKNYCYVYWTPPSGWQFEGHYATVLVSSYCQEWGNRVAAPSGSFYLAVESFGGGATSTSLKQSVVVPPGLVGISLTLQFYMSKRLDELASSSVAVKVNSAVSRTIALTSGFTRYSINTPAATSTMTIQFDDVSPISGDYSYLIDDITLSLAMPTSK